MTISSEVPPKKKFALRLVDEDRRQRRDRREVQRARERQAGEDAVEELGRRPAWVSPPG